MTDDAWFGVTPESIANKIAQHVAIAKPADKSVVIDIMCGVGGNSIALAKSGVWKRVYAIEKDPATLACAIHNAEIYGVRDKITFFQGDCFEILGLDGNKENAVGAVPEVIRRFGVIFASPPWGGKLLIWLRMLRANCRSGPSYKDDHVFDLEAMQPYGLGYMYEKLSSITPNMVLYLPRTSDMVQIGACVPDEQKAQIVHYLTRGASRALCAYLGTWSDIS